MSAKQRALLADVTKSQKAVKDGLVGFASALEAYETAYELPTVELLTGKSNGGCQIYTATNPRAEKALDRLRDEQRKLLRQRESILVWLDMPELRTQAKELTVSLDAVHDMLAKYRSVIAEHKAKSFGKANLARPEKQTDEERLRSDAREFLQSSLGRLRDQVDEIEAEAEALGRGKASKKAKDDGAARHEAIIKCHRAHEANLEKLTRLLDNELIAPSDVDTLKEDILYYVDEGRSADFDLEASLECYETLDLLRPKARGGAGAADGDEGEVGDEGDEEEDEADAAAAAAPSTSAQQWSAKGAAIKAASVAANAPVARRAASTATPAPAALTAQVLAQTRAPALPAPPAPGPDAAEATVALEQAWTSLQDAETARALLLQAGVRRAFGAPGTVSTAAGAAGAAAGAALLAASREGDEAMARLLADSGAPLEARVSAEAGAEARATPLLLACLAGAKGAPLALALLALGANPNVADAAGRTPLTVAIYFGLEEVSLASVVEGADIEARSHGYTPLHYCCLFGRDAIALMLVARGADIWSVGSCGATPLALCRANASAMRLTLAGLVESYNARALGFSAASLQPAEESEDVGMSTGTGSQPLDTLVRAANPSPPPPPPSLSAIMLHELESSLGGGQVAPPAGHVLAGTSPAPSSFGLRDLTSPHNKDIDTTGTRTIFVKGTTALMSRDDILAAFRSFGSVVFFNDKHYVSKGFVHVHFSTQDECLKAVAAKRVMVTQRSGPGGEARPAVSLLIMPAKTASAIPPPRVAAASPVF